MTGHGTWRVHGERTLRGERRGDVLLEPGAVLWLRADVHGDVRVGPGARCHVLAEVSGAVHVDRGVVVVGARVRGGVVRAPGTPAGAVRPARPREERPRTAPTHDRGPAHRVGEPP